MNEKNLKPVRTEAEARAKGRKGGIQSGKTRREKKLMSKIYADFLVKKYKVKKGDKEEEIDGAGVVEEVVKDIMMRRDSASVALMKEIREGTEGSRMSLEGPDGEPLNFAVTFVKPKNARHSDK